MKIKKVPLHTSRGSLCLTEAILKEFNNLLLEVWQSELLVLVRCLWVQVAGS